MGTESEVLTKEFVGNIDKRLGDFGTSLNAKLEEFGKLFPAKVEEIQDPKDPKAEMHQGLEGISKMQVWDIPIGQALVGGFSAVFASELIDGFLAAQSSMIKGVIKLAGAGVAVKWGGRLLGKTGAIALAIILAYDGMRQILPIDEWAGRLAGRIKPLTGGGLGGKAGMGNVQKQANRVLEDYYARAEGRR